MAISRNADAGVVKPLEGSVVERFTAGAAIQAGEIVEMSSDGYIDPADSGTVVLSPVGIALPRDGGDPASAAGDPVDVVTHGPVLCVAGATIAGLVYASDTAGEPSQSAGTKSTVIGFAQSATVVFVRPQVVDLT